jgi:hypothetical protein
MSDATQTTDLEWGPWNPCYYINAHGTFTGESRKAKLPALLKEWILWHYGADIVVFEERGINRIADGFIHAE